MKNMGNTFKLLFLLVVLSSFISAGFSYSLQATLVDDVSVVNSSPTSNYGGVGYITLSETFVSRVYGYFQFDASSIPNNAVITGASLTIYQSDKGSTAGTVVFQRVTDGTKINEDSLTWYTQPVSDSTNQATLSATANGIYSLDVKDIVSYYFANSRRDRIIFVGKPTTISNDNYRNIMSKEGFLSVERAKLLITYEVPLSISSATISPTKSYYSTTSGTTNSLSVQTNEVSICKFNDGAAAGATTADKWIAAYYTMSGTSYTHSYTLPTLSNGNHTLYVYCKSTVSPTTYDTITLPVAFDNALPVTPVISLPTAGQAVTAGTSLSISYSASDALSGVDTGACIVTNTDGTNSSLTYSGGICFGSVTVPFTALGTKTIRVFVKDLAGNTATQSTTVQVSSPSTTATVTGLNINPQPTINTASGFTMQTTCVNGCPAITTYWFLWDDGTVSSSATSTVSKTFYSTGTKSVSLIAENSNGNSTSRQEQFYVGLASGSGQFDIKFMTSTGVPYSSVIPYPTPTKLRVSITPVSEGNTYTCYSKWHCNNTGSCTPESVNATGSDGVFQFSNYYYPEIDSSFNPDFTAPQRALALGNIIECYSSTYPTLTRDYAVEPFRSPYTKGFVDTDVLFEVEGTTGYFTGWNDIGKNVRPVLNITRTYDNAAIGNMTDKDGEVAPCVGTFNGQALNFYYNPSSGLYETPTYVTLNSIQDYGFFPSCSYTKILSPSSRVIYQVSGTPSGTFTIGQSATNLEVLYLDNATEIRNIFTKSTPSLSEPFYIIALYKKPNGELITPSIDSTASCRLNFSYVTTPTALATNVEMTVTNLGGFNTYAVYRTGEFSGEGEYRADVFCSSSFYSNATLSATMYYNQTLYGLNQEAFFSAFWVKIQNSAVAGSSIESSPPTLYEGDEVWFAATYGNSTSGLSAQGTSCMASLVSITENIRNISMPLSAISSSSGNTIFYMKPPSSYFSGLSRYPTYFQWKIRCGATGFVGKSTGWNTLTINDPCPSCIKSNVHLVGDWDFQLRGIDFSIVNTIPSGFSYFNNFLSSIVNLIKTYDDYLWVVAVILAIIAAMSLILAFVGMLGGRKNEI